MAINNYPGWDLIYLHDHKAYTERIIVPLFIRGGYIIILLFVLVGFSVVFLYKRATSEIKRRMELENELKTLSITDELTELYNRRGFFKIAMHQYHASNRDKKRMCLYYFDLDEMKQINDNFGHKEGDNALMDTADLLRSVFRKSDILARIGGDEFAVLMSCDSIDELEVIQTRIQKRLDDHNTRSRRPFKLSLSIGEVVYDPEKQLEFDDFYHEADKAMYKNKKRKQGS